MLTIIAYVYAQVEIHSGGPASLPTSRATLYQAAIGHLLARDLVRGLTDAPSVPDPDAQVIALRSLALEMTNGELGADRMSVDRVILVGSLRTTLAALGSGSIPEVMLSGLIKRSRLLVPDRDANRFRFPHQSFRDALAAQALGDDVAGLMRRYQAARGDWRETVLLWSGLSRPAVSGLVATLFAGADPDERLLALECLTETGDVDPVIAGEVIAAFMADLASGGSDPRANVILGFVSGRGRYTAVARISPRGAQPGRLIGEVPSARRMVLYG